MNVNKNVEWSNVLSNGMRNFSISTEQAVETAKRIKKATPPLSEADVLLIKKNPSLSIYQRWKLIRMIRKDIKK